MKLMTKKKKEKKRNPLNAQRIKKVLEQHPDKNKTLIFGGVLLAITSIGLLIFVLSYKVFHLT